MAGININRLIKKPPAVTIGIISKTISTEFVYTPMPKNIPKATTHARK
jgi:hypothetical protein